MKQSCQSLKFYSLVCFWFDFASDGACQEIAVELYFVWFPGCKLGGWRSFNPVAMRENALEIEAGCGRSD